MAEFLIDFDPKSVSPSHFISSFRSYIETYDMKQVLNLLELPPESSHHWAFLIRVSQLIDFDPSLAYTFLHHFSLLSPLFEEALLEVQRDILDHKSARTSQNNYTQKNRCQIRLDSLPPVMDQYNTSLQHIGVNLVDQLVLFTGTVVRTGGVRMLDLSRQYECQNPRCRYRFTVHADLEENGAIPHPKSCPNKASATVADGEAAKKKCNSTMLREVEDGRQCVDFQEIKLQDHFDRLSQGSLPRFMIVLLQADLVDKVQPGDDVVVIGRVLRQWRGISKGFRSSISVSVLANNIYPHSQHYRNLLDSSGIYSSTSLASTIGGVQFFERFWQESRESPHRQRIVWWYRDRILKAVCPQLHGMYLVKLCLILSLIGGSLSTLDAQMKRNEIHMLMVGDPGCGKSQLLKFAAGLLPRSVLTTGIGTSGAGLTCSISKDRDSGISSQGSFSAWTIEAGAMVLANGGVCCIDEFSSIKEDDRALIHEAMEQQMISVAKAGTVAKLKTKTTVIACCNPKGQFDISAGVSSNTAIASPLLSRFDIILVLLDNCRDFPRDRDVSTSLLSQYLQAPLSAHTASNIVSNDQHTVQPSALDKEWTEDMLSQYISLLRSKSQPITISQEARILLNRYYHIQRQSKERDEARTTVRLLESLLRLAQAHAKLMYRQQVTLEDAVVAILCSALSQTSSSLTFLGLHGSILKEGFQDNPHEQYNKHEEEIMKLLHYSRERLQEDMEGEGHQPDPSLSPTPATLPLSVHKHSYRPPLPPPKLLPEERSLSVSSSPPIITEERDLNPSHSLTKPPEQRPSSSCNSSSKKLLLFKRPRRLEVVSDEGFEEL